MKRFPSIKKNSDFQTIYRTAKSYANRQLVMYVRKTENTQSRIGISVSKKVGNSVVRHHLARLVRETDGVDGALLNLGQSTIQTVGAKPDGSPWRIGIQDPLGEGTALAELKQQQAVQTGDASQAPAIQTEQGSYLGVLELTDRAMSTSGGYQRCFVQDDEIYWHILDPKTAAPARTGLASVTVVADSGLLCDGLSTALFVMGLDRGVQFWQTWRDHKDVSFDCIFITDDGSVYLTPGLADAFTLVDGQSREVTVLS